MAVICMSAKQVGHIACAFEGPVAGFGEAEALDFEFSFKFGCTYIDIDISGPRPGLEPAGVPWHMWKILELTSLQMHK